MRILMWALGTICALLVIALAFVVVDSSGANHETDGTILSTQFVDGLVTTTYVEVGETTVPLRTEIPGAWMAEVDSSILGRIEVPVADDKLHKGQGVYLEYHLGRFSGRAEVLGLHLQREPVGGNFR